MNIEILQNGRVLRSYNHLGQIYIEAPPEGDYQIQLYNNSSVRKLAVLSVDGINAVDGTDAGFGGPGYVLRPWERIVIKGWHRTGSTVANFTFTPKDGGSYASQTGRGTSNVGVIGVAEFEEKAKPLYVPPTKIIEEHHHHHHHWPVPPPRYTWTIQSNTSTDTLGSQGLGDNTRSCTLNSNEDTFSNEAAPCAAAASSEELGLPEEQGLGSMPRLRRSMTRSVGTGYGSESRMYTETTTFERATPTPSLVTSVRYGTREQLIEWGVPLSMQPEPNPFPVGGGVPAPAGWRG